MKLKKILTRVFLGLLAAVLIVLLVLHIGVTVKYWDYYRNADAVFMIPGLMDNVVPQGFDFIPESETYLMCGYMPMIRPPGCISVLQMVPPGTRPCITQMAGSITNTLAVSAIMANLYILPVTMVWMFSPWSRS